MDNIFVETVIMSEYVNTILTPFLSSFFLISYLYFENEDFCNFWNWNRSLASIFKKKYISIFKRKYLKRNIYQIQSQVDIICLWAFESFLVPLSHEVKPISLVSTFTCSYAFFIFHSNKRIFWATSVSQRNVGGECLK